MKKENVEIRALQKSSAKNQLINALEKIEGVKKATVDSAGDTVKVTYNEPATSQQIIHCITGAGNQLR